MSNHSPSESVIGSNTIPTVDEAVLPLIPVGPKADRTLSDLDMPDVDAETDASTLVAAPSAASCYLLADAPLAATGTKSSETERTGGCPSPGCNVVAEASAQTLSDTMPCLAHHIPLVSGRADCELPKPVDDVSTAMSDAAPH